MENTYIDSHAHLTGNDEIYHQVDVFLERAQEAGVSKIVNICTDIPSLEKGLLLAAKYPWVFNSASTTPHDVDKEGDLVFPVIAKTAREGLLKAIGETGLDYHYAHSLKETQQRFLRRYLHLALECQLPVVIHCRDAFDDFFQILDEEYKVNGYHASGVLHCFTGTVKEAEEVISKGWCLSLSGILTFKKSEELREVARMVPLDQLLIETDTPYLAPQKYRGKGNEPAYVVETAKVIAQIKNISVDDVARATTANAIKLFDL